MARRIALVAAALLVVGSGITHVGMGAAQGTAQHSAQPQTPGQAQPGMAEMMKMHEQMMAEMKASDAKLEALVKDMNAATGDAKVNAIAAVVNELASQNKAMHTHMGQMHQHMMGGRGMMMRR